MQLNKTIFLDSAIFMEKKFSENQFWAKVNFCGQKKAFMSVAQSHSGSNSL